MDIAGNWICITAFLIAGVACAVVGARSYRKLRKKSGSKEAWLWFIIAATLLLMIVSKLGHVLMRIGNWARNESQTEGVYDERWAFQLTVVMVASLLCIWLIVYFARYVAARWRRFRWPLMGIGVIICFAIIRAVSLHELDALGVGLTVAKVVVEVAAACAVTYGATRRMRQLKGESKKGDSNTGHGSSSLLMTDE